MKRDPSMDARGQGKDRPLKILVDSGASHSIFDNHLALLNATPTTASNYGEVLAEFRAAQEDTQANGPMETDIARRTTGASQQYDVQSRFLGRELAAAEQFTSRQFGASATTLRLAIHQR